jgi:hypothetical protein
MSDQRTFFWEESFEYSILIVPSELRRDPRESIEYRSPDDRKESTKSISPVNADIGDFLDHTYYPRLHAFVQKPTDAM